MRIDSPTNPFHVARAYGVSATRPARVEPAKSVDSVARIEPAQREPSRLDLLVAAVVPGRVDFSGDSPAPTTATSAALAMYRNPATKNAVATGVETGRRVDLSA